MRISYYLPSGVVTNDAFAELGWSDARIFEKTGIRQRHVCAPQEFGLDLAEQACNRLFEEFAINRFQIDFLLYCTQSPDYVVPNNACILQKRLELRNDTGALDIIQGCSGFVYGLSVAKGLLLTNQASNLLLITADTWSKYIHEKDKGTRSIFGDGAAAVLLSVKDAAGMGNFVFGTDGRGHEHLQVRSSGLRFPRGTLPADEVRDASGNIRTADNLYMNGPEVFSFTLRTVPGVVQRLLFREGLNRDDIDYFVFHQANAFMLEHLRKKLGISEQRFPVMLSDTGNTVSSTIPIVLRKLYDGAMIREGQRIMLVGFGVGYSWNAVIMTI